MAVASLQDVSWATGMLWGKTAPPRLSVRCRRRDIRTRVRAAVVKDTNRVPTQVPVNIARTLADTGNGLPRSDDDDKTAGVPAVQYTWSRERYSRTGRILAIWRFVVTLRTSLFLADQKWSYFGQYSDAARRERMQALAVYTRRTILELGPTFIKIGQLFSSRADILSAEFVQELSQLQDQVPAFSTDTAKSIVEKELGRPIDQMFISFDDRPLAAASLGQVHKAVLKSGESVVVKVQRPGLKALFDIDLEQLRILAKRLVDKDKADGNENGTDFLGIYQECVDILYKEIDYILEGQNADRFRRDFQDVSYVQVPKVYWKETSEKVITLQYCPGIKVTDVARLQASAIDPTAVAKKSTEAFLMQILKSGFFHCDPHPGNIAVDQRGNLIYYDFGMMGEIPSLTRSRLTDLFYAVYDKNSTKVVQILTELGIIKATSTDTISVRRSVQYFIDNLFSAGERNDALSVVGEDLYAVAIDQPFRFPAAFTFVLRSFTTLEGIGKTLNDDFTFAAVAQPYAQELLDLDTGNDSQTEFFETLQDQAGILGTATVNMPARVEKMESLLSSMAYGDLKLRVRVLESERADRRSSILQLVNLNAIATVGFLNAGITLSLNDTLGPACLCLGTACVFAARILLLFKRIERLDKFEQQLK